MSGLSGAVMRPVSSGLLRLGYVDASLIAAGLWRLRIAFTSDAPAAEAMRVVPAEALHLRPLDSRRHAHLRAVRTAWAEPGRVLLADVDLRGASTTAGTYLLRIACPGLVDPAASTARLLAPRALAPEAATASPVDYLTKDYAGFRHLMLNTISRHLPTWSDRSEADLGVTIVESLAYGADFLSYYQDAVATEAYLDTARQRRSVRRHLRLLGYRLGEGCAGRLLVHLVATPGPGFRVPAGLSFLAAPELERVSAADEPAVARVLADGRPVYTQIGDAEISPELNRLAFAMPGRLRAGQTHFVVLAPARGVLEGAAGRLFGVGGTVRGSAVLHPFRLRSVRRSDASGTSLAILEADATDALPWDVEDGAVLVGNLVACEFGRVVRGERLPAALPGRPYRPTLAEPHVVPVSPVDRLASAADLLAPVPETAVAAVTLREASVGGVASDELGATRRWQPATDLLACSARARRFVVELDSDGSATLRFGDGVFGRRPSDETEFVADYRVGSLAAAAVGAGHLDRLVAPTGQIAAALRDRILRVSNSIPSYGLHGPETETRAILHGKAGLHLAHTCATLDDFAAAAGRVAGIAEAVASVRRDGATDTIVVRVRTADDISVAEPLLDAVRAAIAGRMLPGRRLAVLGPRFARLWVGVAIRPDRGIEGDRVREAVEAALREHPDGPFAPVGAMFGRSVFASRILGTVARVRGVAAARVIGVARLGEGDEASGSAPRVELARDEIPVVGHLDIRVEDPR